MMKLAGKIGGMLKAKKAPRAAPGMKLHGTASKFGAKARAVMKPAKLGGISGVANKMRANKAAGVKRPTAPKAAGGGRMGIGPGSPKSQLR